MMTKTFSATLDGIEGIVVQIEAVLLNSLPQITVTGLPGEVVKESRERVRACLVNLGFDVPTGKVVVHLSPANIKKQGSHYDLAIALSILCAESKVLDAKLDEIGLIGELALDGHLCGVRGAFPLIEALHKNAQIKKLIIPKENEREGALLASDKIYIASQLNEVLDFVKGRGPLSKCARVTCEGSGNFQNLFDQIQGQSLAKRAVQISMAGRHHVLLVGPPGVGKSMLSSAASELLPPITHEEFIEIVKIYSASTADVEEITKSRIRPFRSPHHSVSANALLGGGTGNVNPGEISLAHRGLLFMDEFPEYRRDALEGLREPLQTGRVHLTRVGGTLILPSKFTLIAAMNPCPCGMYSSIENRCRCSPEKKAQYQKKLSSPLMDRLAIMVQMGQSNLDSALREEGPNFKNVRESIERTFDLQRRRLKKSGVHGDQETNIQSSEFRLSEELEMLLKEWQKKYRLSFRRTHQVVKVARTIADLNGNEKIQIQDLREAWSLRCFDFYSVF